jgi:hypothetical protein
MSARYGLCFSFPAISICNGTDIFSAHVCVQLTIHSAPDDLELHRKGVECSAPTLLNLLLQNPRVQRTVFLSKEGCLELVAHYDAASDRTTLSCSFARSSLAMSPFHCFPLGLYAGKDSKRSLQIFFASTFEFFKKFLSSSPFSIPSNQLFPVASALPPSSSLADYVEGGGLSETTSSLPEGSAPISQLSVEFLLDLGALYEALQLSGPASAWPCPLCDAHVSELGLPTQRLEVGPALPSDTLKLSSKGPLHRQVGSFQIRTLEQHLRYAEALQCWTVQHPQADPAEYVRKHLCGVKGSPLIHADPAVVFRIDGLHAFTNCCNCCLDMVENLLESAKTSSMTLTMFHEELICRGIPKQKLIRINGSPRQLQGPHCATFLATALSFVARFCSEAPRPAGTALRRMLELMVLIFADIIFSPKPIAMPDVDRYVDWIGEFHSLWRLQWFGHRTIYFHLMSVHMRYQLQECVRRRIPPARWSLEGQEHLNKTIKTNVERFSNQHIGASSKSHDDHAFVQVLRRVLHSQIYMRTDTNNSESLVDIVSLGKLARSQRKTGKRAALLDISNRLKTQSDLS